MRFAFFTTFAPEMTLAECAALGRELGYEGLQPRINATGLFDPNKPINRWANNKNTILEEDFFQNPKEVLKPITDAGLEVTSVASYANVSDMKRVKKLIKACGEIGIKNMRVGPLPLPKGGLFDAEELYKESRARYRRLLTTSRAAGVRLCAEIHMGALTSSPDAAVRLLGGFDPKDVGVLYDPGNMAYEGNMPPQTALSILGEYLAEVHVKNTSVNKADEPGPEGITVWKFEAGELEQGLVNYAHVFDALNSKGYQGWCIEEGHSAIRSTRERLSTSLSLMKRLAARSAKNT